MNNMEEDLKPTNLIIRTATDFTRDRTRLQDGGFLCKLKTNYYYYTNIYNAQINSEPQMRAAAIKG